MDWKYFAMQEYISGTEMKHRIIRLNNFKEKTFNFASDYSILDSFVTEVVNNTLIEDSIDAKINLDDDLEDY